MTHAGQNSKSVPKLLRLLTPLFVFGLGSSALCQSLPHAAVLAKLPSDQDVQLYLSQMDLDAKIGQMIQAEILNINEVMEKGGHPIRDLGIGSVLAGGNSIIDDNTPAGWRKFLAALQAEAAASRAGFPLLTGVDAVHGHAIVKGATVFPHNIGLGAARDPELMKEIGSAVAKEVLSTGFNWTFAPAVSVARDPRWGRTYESFGQEPELQTLLAGPYIHGLQETALDNTYMSATAKHFIGDGGTIWGTGFEFWVTGIKGIDRGDTQGDLQSLMDVHGRGYIEAIKADVNTVMISYNLVNGTKMHANRDLVANFLKVPQDKGGLGFNGIVVSDWNAVDEIPFKEIKDKVQRYKAQVIESVLAGTDMIMVEGKVDLTPDDVKVAQQDIVYDSKYRYERVHQFIKEGVNEGRIPMERIDDAVSRILAVKLKTGLTRESAAVRAEAHPGHTVESLGSHRELARRAVQESLVLLKNQNETLPIAAGKYSAVCVIGSKADDFGVQAGAWTTGWQGTEGNGSKTEGAKTILDGLREQAAAANIPLYYAAQGSFQEADCSDAKSLRLVVIGEKPYAEFFGDSAELQLPEEDLKLLGSLQGAGPVAVVLISGRPVMINQHLDRWDALVAAWLPGSQGEGVADVLFAKKSFKGRLTQSWPTDVKQLPLVEGAPALFPYDFGLKY